MLRQMLTCIEGGVDRSIEKWGVEVDDLAFSLKSSEMWPSVVSDQCWMRGSDGASKEMAAIMLCTL